MDSSYQDFLLAWGNWYLAGFKFDISVVELCKSNSKMLIGSELFRDLFFRFVFSYFLFCPFSLLCSILELEAAISTVFGTFWRLTSYSPWFLQHFGAQTVAPRVHFGLV